MPGFGSSELREDFWQPGRPLGAGNCDDEERAHRLSPWEWLCEAAGSPPPPGISWGVTENDARSLCSPEWEARGHLGGDCGVRILTVVPVGDVLWEPGRGLGR